MGADWRFLTVDQVLRMHEDLLARYGGNAFPGHRGEEDGVAAAVGAVASSYYADVFELAAAYAVYIVMGHVFGDGNKRTGSAAALTFLGLNRVEVRARPRELLDLMLDIQNLAESEPRPAATELVNHMAAWLRRRRVRRRK